MKQVILSFWALMLWASAALAQAAPMVGAPANQVVCAGTSVTVSGSVTCESPCMAYINGPEGQVAQLPLNANESGTITANISALAGVNIYTITATDGFGGAGSANFTITGNSLPTVSLSSTPGAGASVALGDGIIFTPSGASTYDFFEDSNLVSTAMGSFNHAPTTLGVHTYWVIGTDANGCSAQSTSQTFNVLEPLALVGSWGASYCSGTPVVPPTLAATGGLEPYTYTYLWLPGGQTTAQADDLPLGPNTLRVTVTDALNTSIFVDLNVTINALPNVSFTYAPVNPVAGSAIDLVGSSGLVAYEWFVDSVIIATSQNTSYAPSAAGTYTYRLDGTNANGCVGTFSQAIVVQPSSSPIVPVCGNGILEAGESCDNGASGQAGCSAICVIAAGYTCMGSPSTCFPIPVHGNGILEPGETCDDGNTVPGDGCDSEGRVEPGFLCVDTLKICVSSPVHGNGVIDFGESCDDGNTTDGDGCSASGLTESGYACPKAGELCTVDDAATGGGATGQCNGCNCSATRSGNSQVPLGDILFLGLLGLISLRIRPQFRHGLSAETNHTAGNS